MSNSLDNNDLEAGFIQRWSRRKVDARSEEGKGVVKEVGCKELTSSEPTTELTSSEPTVEISKTDADMLPIEELTEESDYSDFLSPGVSKALRKQALRKLFHLPFMNIVDGLDDYAEDYSSFVPLGDVVPWEMKRMLDREKEREEEESQETSINGNDNDVSAKGIRPVEMDDSDNDIEEAQLSTPEIARSEDNEQRGRDSLVDHDLSTQGNSR